MKKEQPTFDNLFDLFKQMIELKAQEIAEEIKKQQLGVKKEFITLKEMSELVGVPLRSLKAQEKEGRLKFHRPNTNTILVSIDEYERYVQQIKKT